MFNRWWIQQPAPLQEFGNMITLPLYLMNYTVPKLIEELNSKLLCTCTRVCPIRILHILHVTLFQSLVCLTSWIRVAKFRNIVLNKHKLKSLGFERFSVSGPQLWNNLSKSLKGSALILFLSLNTYMFYEFLPSS